MIRAFFMALGMFSIFPAKNSWDEKRASLVAPMLPVVGIVIGLAWYGTAIATARLPLMLHCAAITLAPLLLTGFLHIDGFMDTADAVLSRRSLEEKIRILKDPAAGAFAVISVVCFILLQFCAVVSFAWYDYIALIFIPILSRCIIAYLLISLEPISQSGYMHTFQKGTGIWHKASVFILAAVTFVTAYFIGGINLLFVLAVTFFSTLLLSLWLNKQFKGFSGDLCGCAITTGELCGLLTLAVIGRGMV